MKKSNLANKSRETIFNTLRNFIKPRKIIRQTVSLVLILAIYFVPLFSADSSILKAFAKNFGSSCFGADRILQGCPLGGGQVEDDLTNQAIDDVIALYDLPPTDRSRVMSYARSEVRSALFVRLNELIKKQSPTAEEQTALAVFAGRLRQRRVLVAQKAKDEYDRWSGNPCIYTPPSPYTYKPGGACHQRLISYFTGPIVPSFEEFQQFGSAIAYQDLYTPEAQDISQRTTQTLIIGFGMGLTAVAGAFGAVIGSTITFGTLAAIVPTAGVTFASSGAAVLPAATAASGSVGASAVAGPAAIIVAGLIILVVQGINVGNASQLPNKLQEALNTAQTQNINLLDLTANDGGNQEIYLNFMLETLPDYPGTQVPPVDPNDRRFVIRQNGVGGTTENNIIIFKTWEGGFRSVRLNGGWFVEEGGNVSRQTLSIEYLDWLGQKKIAARKGFRFVITDPLDINKTELVDEITYIGSGSNFYGAKIKFTAADRRQ